MDNFENIFRNYFDAYKTTSGYKDNSKMEIMLRKKEFEDHLNTMWAIYSKGNPAQIVEYNKQVKSIKDAGLKVMRNSDGMHKIVLPK